MSLVSRSSKVARYGSWLTGLTQAIRIDRSSYMKMTLGECRFGCLRAPRYMLYVVGFVFIS